MSKKTNFIFALMMILLMGLFLQNCTESITEPLEIPQYMTGMKKNNSPKATGEVEIIWKGGNGENSPDVDKRAFADFNAHMATDKNPAKGEFIYRVCSADLTTVHREIIAEVHKVALDVPYTWIVAKVISDSKGCSGGDTVDGHSIDCPGRVSGGPGSGHDEGCGGDDSSGGCSGDDHSDGGSSGGPDMGGSGCGEDHTDDGTDGGCSGDHTDDGTDGGCSGDHTDDGTDGGCSGDHTDDGTDGGCSGDDHSGGSPGGNSNNPKGYNCRVEQRVFIMVYDGGTPGTSGDEIEWKWFYKSSSNKPHWPDSDTSLQWSDFESWHLCEKDIIGGNLVVHNEADGTNFIGLSQ